MTRHTALRAIFVVSLAGLGFSGVLSYLELWGDPGASCPAPGAPGTVLGYPACIYGFFMYLALAVLSFLGLKARA
jgi:hypothetical protein